jgi:hypothetical protein
MEFERLFRLNLTLYNMPGYNKRKEHYQDFRVNIGNVADIESSKKPPKTREELIIEELELKRKMMSSIEADLEKDRNSTIEKGYTNSSNLNRDRIYDKKFSKTAQDDIDFNKRVNAIVLSILIVGCVILALIIGLKNNYNEFETKPIINETAPTENSQINQPEIIYFQDFKLKVQGKTEEQIRDMFGNPDQAQEVVGVKMWYYRKGSKNLRIINEDTEKDVNIVQILFVSESAYSINAW